MTELKSFQPATTSATWGSRNGERILHNGTLWLGRCAGHGSPIRNADQHLMRISMAPATGADTAPRTPTKTASLHVLDLPSCRIWFARGASMSPPFSKIRHLVWHLEGGCG